jgi:ABC-type transport system involved in multi-copper enzyme maturation permease subunit
MIRALFLRSLRQHAGLLGVLSLGLFLFEWAIVWVAARIDMGPGFRQLLGTILPPNVVETIFGQFGFASFGGAVSFGYQHPLALIAAIAMVMVMATLPAHERETGFLDLVLAKPIPRARYMAASGLLVCLGAVLPALSLLAGGALGLAVVEAPEPVTWIHYLPSAGAMALLLLTVGAYSLLFSTEAKRRGIAVAQGVGVTLLFYWLDFMGDYWDLLDTARLLSPFHFFDPALAAASGIPARDAMVLVAVFLAATGGAFINFNRQDL